MNNPFLKYVMKDTKEDIFHSSVYGKAQNGSSMGSASTESFGDRMKVDKNRQVVHGYNDSQIANNMYTNGPKAKKYVPPEKRKTGEKTGTSRIPSPTSSAQRPASPKPSFTPNIKPNFGK